MGADGRQTRSRRRQARGDTRRDAEAERNRAWASGVHRVEGALAGPSGVHSGRRHHPGAEGGRDTTLLSRTHIALSRLPARGGKEGTCPRRSPAASFQKEDSLSPSNMGGDCRTKTCPLEKRFVVSKAFAKPISLFDAPNSPLTWVGSQFSDEETEAQTGQGGAQQIHVLGD